MSSNNISNTLNNIFRIVSGQQRQEHNGEQPQDVPVEPTQSSDAAVHPPESPQDHASTPMDVDPPHSVRRPRQATQDHGDDEDEDMPALQDVSESDESGDENFSAIDSDMDADIPPQTDSEQLASGLNSDAPSGAATPSRGSRRARGEHDDDDDRDRRHPSQRIARDIAQPVDNPIPPPNAVPPPAPPRRAGIPNGFHLLGLSIDLPSGQFRPIPVLNGHAAPDLPLPMPDALFVNDLFTRLGGIMGGLGIPEREDPERAKQLVGALEEVPVGLVRRLERISAVGGADDNGTLGDSGCAICWDKLLDGDGSGFGDRENMEENVAGSGEQSVPPTSETAPIESDTPADHPKIVALPCAHIFHASCLIPWFSRPRQTTCPTCRFNIDPENLTGRRRLPRSVPNPNAPQPLARSEATAQPQQPHDGTHPPEDAGAHPALPQDYGRILFERFLQSIGERMTSRDGQQAATPNSPPSTTQPDTGAGVTPGQGPPQPLLNVPPEPHVHINHGFDGAMIIDMVSILDEPTVGHAQTPTASDNASRPNPDAVSQSDDPPAPAPANASESTPPHIHTHPLGPAQALRPGEDHFVTLGFNMTFGVGLPGDDNLPGQLAGQGGPTDEFADAFNGLFGQPPPRQASAANPTAAQGPDNGAQMFGGTVPFAMGRTIEELFTNMSARLAMWPGQAPPPPPQADGQAPLPHPQADGQPQAAAAAQAAQDQHPLGPFPFPFQLPPLQPHVVNGVPQPAGPLTDNTETDAVTGGPQLPHFTQFLHNAGLPPGGPFVMGGAPIRHPRMPTPRRERKAWTLPSAPGPTLRQRVEKKEREVGLRCDDISCGVGPSDEDPTVEVSEKRITISKGSIEEGSICSHTFHPSCLVTSQRVALKGSEEKVEGEMVDVSCPVCRADGMIAKVDWDAGTLV